MSFIDGVPFFFFFYVHRMSLDNRCPCQTLINHQYQLPKTNTIQSCTGKHIAKAFWFFYNHFSITTIFTIIDGKFSETMAVFH